jgi:hypothetical protein
MKSHIIFPDFRAGELSPLLDGQVGFDKYYSGLKTMENFFPRPQGPASNRSGFRYIAGAKNNNRKCRLVPFEFSTDQAYILEFGHQYIRVFMNQGQVMTLDSDTKLYLRMNGTDASQTFTDESTSGHTVTANGHAQIDTADKKFGTGAGLFDGTGDFLTVSDHADFDLTGGIWTIDCWIKTTAIGSVQGIFSQKTGVNDYIEGYIGAQGQVLLQIYEDVAGVPSNVVNIVSATGLITADTWYHIEFVENGNSWYIFIDGVSVATGTDTGRAANYTGDFTIAADSTTTNEFNGWIDEFRLSKGVARHTANFTPPTLEYIVSAGTVVEASGSPTYTENELPELQFTQSADILYITHPNHAPATLTRTGHTAWTLADYAYQRGPFRDTNITATTITPSADTGNGITLTASSSIFLSTHIGSLVRIKSGVVEIKTYASGTSVTADVQAEPDGTAGDLNTGPGATTDWAEGAWSDSRGWPSSVVFFEQRLWWAMVQTLYSSKSGDYPNMDVGTGADDEAVIYTIASSQVNKIQWLSSGKILIVGTAGGEYKVSASSQDEAITPTNVRIVKQSSYGSAYHESVEVKDVVLYLQRSKRSILEFAYRWEEQTYVSPDMTDLAEHITKDYIEYMAYQQRPFSILWCVRNDGVLVGMTYDRERQMIAWHKHVSTDSTGDSVFESVAVIPSIEGNGYDELWVVVKRTINGSVVRYIEMLEQQYDGEALNSDECFFLDSGLSYNGVATSSISGLDHLEGETVSVLADGVVFDDAVVSSGAITLKLATVTTTASVVHVGLAYTATLQTMRIEKQDVKGTSQGRKKRTNQVVFRLKDVKQYKYGSTPTGTLKEITESALTSGDKEVEFVKGWDREGYITVKQEKPLPCTLVAIIAEVDVT